MERTEIHRRWAAGESQRAIARALGLSRNTVAGYLKATRGRETGVPAGTSPVEPGGRRPGPPPGAGAHQQAALALHQERIAQWLQERLQLTRIQELLRPDVRVSHTTLRRFVQQHGLRAGAKTTVRMAEWAPGEVVELDFGRLGPLVDAHTGKRRIVWALVLVLPFSRHGFVWPLLQQTLPDVIAGLEAAWAFFDGIPQRLILDNFPAAVAGPDPLTPRPTRGFLEYSQARGFLLDPARVRHPQDKPHVERHIQYVRERFFKGGTFADLLDLRAQAARWCREVAGQRVHGTTRQPPLVVFEEQERAHLQPAPTDRYDVPIWRTVRVHPDHHISFGQAIYSVPATTCPPGTELEVRGDTQLVRLYRRGALVKVHSRVPRGGRMTDPDDYPAERTTYALRAPDRVIRQAQAIGEQTGRFAAQLLAGPLPWAKLRQGLKLLRLAERYTPARLEAACARALAFELVDVRRVERILVRALEQEGQPVPPPEDRIRSLPPGRFARPGAAFAHQPATPEERP